MIDHDRLFKELLTTFFVEFLELFAPELATDLDKSSLAFLDKEIFTDVTSGDRHEVDVLARARFRGEEACFLIHIENQAQSQTGFPARMFRYFARLDEKYQVPIYPIAIFSHYTQRPEPASYEIRFPDLEVLQFRFRTIQLKHLAWRDFIRHPNPVAAALMSQMKMTKKDRPRVKLECLRLLVTLRLDRARQRLISGFVDTYLQLNKDETLQFDREADSILGPREREEVMELTTSWKEEGRQEGRQEGEAEVILRLLHHRFGPLAAETHEQVRHLPVTQLETLAEALLEFTAIQELLDWLNTSNQE